jgi:hypothetical protein
MRLRLAVPRLLIKLIMITGLILAAVVTLIHTRPFDDAGFQALIFANTCSSACFAGIQPGVTTLTEARDLLEKHHLVSQWIEPTQQQAEPTIGVLRWRWSSSRPQLLTGTDANLTYDRKTGVVMTFSEMQTRLTTGELLVMLGQPGLGYMSGGYNDRGGPIFTHVVGYSQYQLNLISAIQCPMTVHELWAAPASLQIAPTSDQTARFAPYPAHIQAILGYAAYTFC